MQRTLAGSLALSLALAGAALLLFAAAMTGPIARISTLGQDRVADMLSGPTTLWQSGLVVLAILVLFTSVAAPLVVAACTFYVLLGVRWRFHPRMLRAAFVLRNRLRPWSMVEVFIIGYFIAYSKLGAIVQVTIGSGFIAYFLLMVVSVGIDIALDHEAVWAAIGRDDSVAFREAPSSRPDGLRCCLTCHFAVPAADVSCPRCGANVPPRKLESAVRTSALVAAGLALYLPANVYPVLSVIQFGRGSPSTIIGGVWELLGASEYGLAILVFAASIAVPVLKLTALFVMLLIVARRRRNMHLHQLTMLYRVIAVIGRWSMIDIFMESILGGLVQFGQTARMDPGTGAIPFAAVVVLTMIAVECFDPRLMWDAAG